MKLVMSSSTILLYQGHRKIGQLRQQPQTGVVLVIALILLIVISLLAVTSIRNAGSSESISGNVRTTELATQAADIALRHCEASIINVENIRGGAPATYTPAYTPALVESNVIRASSAVTWQGTTNWDGTSTLAYVLPSGYIGGTATFKRPPECMVESLTGTAPASTGANAAFTVTARGFGPEVAAADNARSRPVGTVVWLQSTLQIQ